MVKQRESSNKGALRRLETAIGLAAPIVALVAILDVPLFLSGVSLFTQQYLGLFWGLISALVFLTVPASKKQLQAGARWYDLILAGASLCAGVYVAVCYPQLLRTLGVINTRTVILGIAAVVVVLESTRRLTGWILVVIVAAFIFYARFADIFPGPLEARPLSWSRLVSQLYLGADFLYGTPLRITVLVVFGFVLFGQFLFATGAGDFFVRLAEGAMGRQRGGPAKVAVVASSLFGTISGSAVSNVASTGIVTIPLMKKIGYPPVFAAAVEAVSSTGGCIMPPVMGAAAFIMAEFVGVPYATVVIAAIVPAVLYYLGDFMQVHLRAVKMGLEGLPPEKIPPLGKTLRQGWFFLIPVAVLVYTLFILYLPAQISALAATAALLVVAAARKDSRPALAFTKMIAAFRSVTKSMLEITVVCAAAGFIVGIISYTGLGFSLSAMLAQLGSNNLLLLAVLTAGVSTILGMGMPVAATYLLLAALVAPAMVKLGVEPLLAHLFIFYFGTFSFLTPPVCVAVYAASSIADSPVMATALQSVKLAIAGYLVPFIFLYKPGLAFQGSARNIVWAIFDGVLGTVLLASAAEGQFLLPAHLLERIALATAGILFFVPGWETRVAGFVIAAAILLFQWQGRHKTRAAVLAAAEQKQGAACR
jgi:TRAP transporter 4TM/12TM fusion protein